MSRSLRGKRRCSGCAECKNDCSFVHGGFGFDAQDWEPRCTLDDATWFNSVITNRDNNVKATSEWDSKDAKTL